MKIYLAGPMRGIEDYNYPLFHAAAAELRERGHHVVNPAELFDNDTSLPRSHYLREGIRHLIDCDAIVMLPDWPGSPGAVLELTVASNLELQVLEHVRGEEPRPLFSALVA